MFYTALVVLFLIPTMLGLAEILHFFKVSITSKKKPHRKCMLVALKGDDPELDLLSVVEEYRWNGREYAEKIIAVNLGLSDPLRQKCLEIAQENDILFCNFENLCELLKEEF